MRDFAMVEHEGGTAFAPRVRSQYGGGAYVYKFTMLTVTDGSSIDDNTAATVKLPAFALTLWARGWFAK